MDTWRLLPLSVNDAYTNMAIDETIARLKLHNTIRFYRWKPSAVSIGYFQSVEQEVNLERCKSLGIDLIRRMTGGGAVYHDYSGELTYSLIAPQDHPKIPSNILESYDVLCRGIILGLEGLGIPAAFKPINDIIVGSRKISGNAQTRRFGSVVQHGTILMDPDIKTMFEVLNVSKVKISDKMIKSAEERVTTIKSETGRDTDFGELAKSMKAGFEKALSISLVEGGLEKQEMELVKELVEKYRSKSWNFERRHEN